MTTTSTKPDPVAATGRAARYPDLAVRLKGRLRSLRARLARRDTLVELIHRANAVGDSRALALWLTRLAADWIPAPVWAVVSRGPEGSPRILAAQGVTPEFESSIWSAATIVMRRHTTFAAADLSIEPDALPEARGSVLAFPLQSRDQVLGALIGLDPTPSAIAPSLGASVDPLLRSALDPVAIALDNALRLERAEALSVTDDLTRLYNARHLDAALRREAKLASRNERPVSLIFLDLDGFKNVNDRFGHLIGSKALVEVGAALKGCARETDILARYGGDEFAIVLPDTAAAGAVRLAQRIHQKLNSHIFLTGEGLAVQLTASIGIATLPDAAASAEDLLKVADTAMYRVKASGKNGIQAG